MMYTYSINDKKSPTDLEDQERANRYVVQEVCRVDPGVILIKTIGAVPEGRLTPTSDYDYCVFSLSPSAFRYSDQVSVPNVKGKWRCLDPELSRPLSVTFLTVNEVLQRILALDFKREDHLTFYMYFHYVVWNYLCSNNPPLYVNDKGEELLNMAVLFINRETVEHVDQFVKSVHPYLTRDKWEKWKVFRKHSKSVLYGLQMCKWAIDGNLLGFDIKLVPHIPASFDAYVEEYKSLVHEIDHDLIKQLPPMDRISVTDAVNFFS